MGEDSPLKYFGRKNSNWSIKDANDEEEYDVLQEPKAMELRYSQDASPLKVNKTSTDLIDLAHEGLKILDSPNAILSHQQFCFQYYHKKYLKMRMAIIKELFRKITSQWQKNFVIYPLGSCSEIQHCISRFYYITYEVDSPIK